jgi:formate dehydrogenase iron-sulfur subunit
MLACPFHIPRYEWDNTVPYVVKCDLCAHRVDSGRKPACVDACPQGALVFGERNHLLEQARTLIRQSRGYYVDHIWGEHEFGGTSILYVSDVDLASLGWPTPEPVPIPSLTEALVHKTPFIGFGVGLGLIGLNWIVKRRMELGAERDALEGREREAAWRPGDEDDE